jgi:hypothetical protein
MAALVVGWVTDPASTIRLAPLFRDVYEVDDALEMADQTKVQA